MKTTITINNLPIEFTDTPPTRPGAYWWIHRNGTRPILKEVFNPCTSVLIDRQTDLQPKDVEHLWSAPLVPVTEVENGYFEGVECASDAHANWNHSRARRVVEGEPINE